MLTGSRERWSHYTNCCIVCNSLDFFRIWKSRSRRMYRRSVAGIHSLCPLCLLPPKGLSIVFHNCPRLQEWSWAGLKRRLFLLLFRPQTESLDTASKGKNLTEHSVKTITHTDEKTEIIKNYTDLESGRSMRVSTANRQMARRLTVNRQKRSIFTLNRQTSEPILATRCLRYPLLGAKLLT